MLTFLVSRFAPLICKRIYGFSADIQNINEIELCICKLIIFAVKIKMEISIKWNMCRVCLQEPEKDDAGSAGVSEPMRCIFNDSKLAKQIYECTGVMMQSDDCLPEKICHKCLTVLRYAVNFRTTCRNSDEYLQSVLRKTKSATSLFKLDRHREEAMDMVNEVNDPLFAIDVEADDIAAEGGHGDSVIRKEMKTKLLQRIKKTTNIFTQEDTGKIVFAEDGGFTLNENLRENAEKPLDAERATSVSLEAGGHASDSHMSKETSMFEITLEESEEEQDVEEQDIEELEDNKDCKRSRFPKNTSECSIEDDGYIEDGDEEHNSNLDVSNVQKDEFMLQSGYATKPFLELDPLNETTLGVSKPPATTIPNDVDNDAEELFFILDETDIKQESHHSNETVVDVTPAIEFVPMIDVADDVREGAEPPNITVGESDHVEYLVDESPKEDYTLEVKNDQIPVGNTNSTVMFKRHLVHTRKKVGEVDVYICDLCGNHFTNRSLMNCHMKVHRNEKNYECELCFKRFNAACNLSAHMRIHTGEKKYECAFCGRRFTDRSTHIKHERIHTNEKPFTCSVCGKSFALSTTLKAHEKIHTDEKPFKCETCEKAFKLRHQWKAHLNTHLHKIHSAETSMTSKSLAMQISKK